VYVENKELIFSIKLICIKVDVNSGSIIEVLGNIDNRNQIIGDTIVTFEPEQTANFGKNKNFQFLI
jgi:hypothetical protein